MKKKIITIFTTFLISINLTSQVFAATTTSAAVTVAGNNISNIISNATDTSIKSTSNIQDNKDITDEFTDENFKAKILSILNMPTGNRIYYQYVKNIFSLSLYNCKISNLHGIEYFTSLNSLDCRKNNLTTLNLSKNARLAYLKCSDNKLANLDVSNNTQLRELDCAGNSLTTLDIDKNSQLYILQCFGNQLETLDISTNAELEHLDCHRNNLTTLDIKKNTKLTSLDCNDNQLTTLDVSNNTLLTQLIFYNNQISTIDVSKNTKLKWLWCMNNQIATLDVSNNTELTKLFCDNNKLTTLDVSKNTALESVSCNYNEIKTLYVHAIPHDYKSEYNPQYVDSIHNTTTSTLIEQIPLSDNMDITNKFTDTNFKAKVYSAIGKDSSSPICYIDVKNVTSLDVSSSNISDLSGIEYFTALTKLICNSNKLTTLNTSKNTELTSLMCNCNNLTSLNLDENRKLTALYCDSNKISALDVSKNTSLYELWCTYNQLSTLDVSNNTSLSYLLCDHNQITIIYIHSIPSKFNVYNPQYIDSTSASTTSMLTEQIK